MLDVTEHVPLTPAKLSTTLCCLVQDLLPSKTPLILLLSEEALPPSFSPTGRAQVRLASASRRELMPFDRHGRC